MKNLSLVARLYIISIILVGFGPIFSMVLKLDWSNIGLYFLAALGAVAQTFKVEGPNHRTNYSIAWFVYGFAFIALSPEAAIFVIVLSHLVDWIWNKYPWYIQSFNIGNHVLSVYLAGVVFEAISQGTRIHNLYGPLGMIVANLIFVFGNHFMVGVVVKLARGQSFADSGVFDFLTLTLDFTILSLGAATALIWLSNPFASLLNVLPLYLLYKAIRIPALERQLREMRQLNSQRVQQISGD